MVTPELLTYIQGQVSVGEDRSLIIQNLQSSGWSQSDIEDAFSQLSVNSISTIKSKKSWLKWFIISGLTLSVVLVGANFVLSNRSDNSSILNGSNKIPAYNSNDIKVSTQTLLDTDEGTSIKKKSATQPTGDIADLGTTTAFLKDDSTKVCIFYENKGPGITQNASLLIALDNAVYGSSDVPAERNMQSFGFGWELGNLEAGDSGYLLATIIPLEDDKPVKIVSSISDGLIDPPDDFTSIDPNGADSTSNANENLTVVSCGP